MAVYGFRWSVVFGGLWFLLAFGGWCVLLLLYLLWSIVLDGQFFFCWFLVVCGFDWFLVDCGF